jgi:hypothetical protein
MMKIGPAVAAASAFAIASPVCAQDAVQWRVEDGGNGHWYQLEGPYFVSWLSARTYAESMGGHLVTLTSETEQAVAADVAFNSTPNQVDDCWLGAMQDLAASDFSEPAGGWRWVTGEPWGFTAWRTITGAPNGPGEFLVSTTVPSDQLRWVDGRAPHEPGNCQAFVEWSADCNSDGIVDYGQIRDGTFTDLNANGVPDCCEPGESCTPCPGDVTNGGTVDAADLSILLAAWGTNGQGEFDTDLNGDGLVDGGDLALVLGGWGACP